MKRKTLFVHAVFLFLISCSPSMASIDFQDAASPCDYSENDLGEQIKVGGLLEFVDDSVPNGWYADLEREGCRIGVWVTADDYATWKGSVPQAFEEEAVVSVTGVLTQQPLPDRPDEFQLIVEVESLPQVLLTSTGDEGDPIHTLPACTYAGIEEHDAITVTGEVTLKDDSAAAGVYVELEADGCYSRIWIERRFWDTWNTDEQDVIALGNQITVSGIFTNVRGEDTVDISEPAIQAAP